MGIQAWSSPEGHGLCGKTGGQGGCGPVCLQGLSSTRCLSLHSGSRVTLWSAAERDRSSQEVWEAVSPAQGPELGVTFSATEALGHLLGS